MSVFHKGNDITDGARAELGSEPHCGFVGNLDADAEPGQNTHTDDIISQTFSVDACFRH